MAEGGRMIIPVGPSEAQELQLIQKRDGKPLITVLDGCRFVPLIVDAG
jgi:protein-L-isoaspartate O-methyltransferase